MGVVYLPTERRNPSLPAMSTAWSLRWTTDAKKRMAYLEHCGSPQGSWACVRVDQCSRFPKVLPSLLCSKQFLEWGEAGLNLGLYSGIKEKLGNPCTKELGFLVPSPWELFVSSPWCFYSSTSIGHIWYANVYWMSEHISLKHITCVKKVTFHKICPSRSADLPRHLLREPELIIFVAPNLERCD